VFSLFDMSQEQKSTTIINNTELSSVLEASSSTYSSDNKFLYSEPTHTALQYLNPTHNLSIYTNTFLKIAFKSLHRDRARLLRFVDLFHPDVTFTFGTRMCVYAYTCVFIIEQHTEKSCVCVSQH